MDHIPKTVLCVGRPESAMDIGINRFGIKRLAIKVPIEERFSSDFLFQGAGEIYTFCCYPIKSKKILARSKENRGRSTLKSTHFATATSPL